MNQSSSPPDFFLLTKTLVSCIASLRQAVAQVPAVRVVGKPQLESRNGQLRVNGNAWPPSKTPLTSHESMTLLTAGLEVAQAIDALEQAIETIPGIDPDWTQLLLKASLSKAYKDHGILRLESAGVCASGETWMEDTPLETQAELLAKQLTRAYTVSNEWELHDLQVWYVTDIPDTRGPGGLVRECRAPDAESALLVDGWTSWSITPQPEHQRSVSAQLDDEPVLIG